MSARAASGDAVTGTGPSVLTVSSRTEPDTGHPPATGTLTPDDANPPLRAHRESRRTDEIHPPLWWRLPDLHAICTRSASLLHIHELRCCDKGQGSQGDSVTLMA
jgi:hypothetical protein